MLAFLAYTAAALFFSAVTVLFLVRLGSPTAKRVCIVVLGDFGRSPRMQYHSLSLAALGHDVDVIAYGGSRPHQAVLSSTRIHLHRLYEAPALPASIAKPLYIPYIGFKAVFLALQLLFRLVLALPAYQWCLVQNPPTIPTLFIAWLACRLRRAKLVIDWHNYGFSILALARSPTHPLVRFARWFEFTFGRFADSNFCVTDAMRKDLRRWGIDAKTLYDHAPSMFKQASLEEKHELITKLESENPGLFTKPFSESNTDSQAGNLVTAQSNVDRAITLRKGRPALLVSSTSWTEDEDFSMLLSALETYDAKATANRLLPNIICMITGKGPLKEYYERQMASRAWTNVRIKTLWLQAEDYPKLLGSCDLGVCLHKSSSGLDLPMKVVDMFGCGLPVCAVGFPCLHELVEHRKNGLVFKDTLELASQLELLLSGFPEQQDSLTTMRRYIASKQTGWDREWTSVAETVFSPRSRD